MNGWIGGFETILKRMTQGNFNWFLHTMLFLHTVQAIEKQKARDDDDDDDDEDDDDDDDEDDVYMD